MVVQCWQPSAAPSRIIWKNKSGQAKEDLHTSSGGAGDEESNRDFATNDPSDVILCPCEEGSAEDSDSHSWEVRPRGLNAQILSTSKEAPMKARECLTKASEPDKVDA